MDMQIIIETAKALGLAPGPIALVIVAYWYFKSNNGNSNGHKRTNGTQYVLRSECHTHIDGLKADMHQAFDGMKSDIRELHTKQNDTAKAVARIEGYLQRTKA